MRRRKVGRPSPYIYLVTYLSSGKEFDGAQRSVVVAFHIMHKRTALHVG